jgi:hypothetical protein
MKFHLLIGLVPMSLFFGCTPVHPIAGPSPNPDIAATTGPITLPYIVECDGPTDELEVLGDLCGSPSGDLYRLETRGHGFATMVGPDEGPLLLIFAESTGEADDLPETLGYAAYIRLDGYLEEGGYAAMQSWRDAIPVTEGAVVTRTAEPASCSPLEWIGQGELLFRNTTLTLAWSAGGAC